MDRTAWRSKIRVVGSNHSVGEQNLVGEATAEWKFKKEPSDLPVEFKCPLCNTFFKEAVLIPCCQHSFCKKCISFVLLEKKICPICFSIKCKVEDLLPNLSLRQAIEHFFGSQVLGTGSPNDLCQLVPDGESGIQAREISCAVTVIQREPDSPHSPSATGHGSNQVLADSFYEPHRRSKPHKMHMFDGKRSQYAHLNPHGGADDVPITVFDGGNQPFNLCKTRVHDEGAETKFWATGRHKQGARTCYICGSPEHLMRNCTASNSLAMPQTGHHMLMGGMPGYPSPYWNNTMYSPISPFTHIYGNPEMMPFRAPIIPTPTFSASPYMPSMPSGVPLNGLRKEGMAPLSGTQTGHLLNQKEFMESQQPNNRRNVSDQNLDKFRGKQCYSKYDNNAKEWVEYRHAKDREASTSNSDDTFGQISKRKHQHVDRKRERSPHSYSAGRDRALLHTERSISSLEDKCEHHHRDTRKPYERRGHGSDSSWGRHHVPKEESSRDSRHNNRLDNKDRGNELRNGRRTIVDGLPFLKLNRNLDIGHKKFMLNCAKANIGTMKSYRLFKESVGGYDNVGATAVDFKNFKRDLKAYIAGGDAQMVIDKLFRKHETCSAFFFEYDVDESDQLTRLFWCDPVARKNYSLFGDVVSFDATYETNRYNMIFAPFTSVDNHCKCITFGAGLLTREDDESYAWLFRRFLNAMGNAPKCIITDQDLSLRGAAQKAFPRTSHRYCMWHIMKKVGGKVDDELAKDSEFLTKLNAIVWSHYLEPIDFEKKWHDLMAAYNLDNHKWFQKLFEIRFSWIPAYYRDLFMGGLLRTTSRSESENSFFDDFTGQNFSLVELLMQFESAVDSQRHKNADLNADDEACYPEFKTPLDIEHHAASVYTITIFYEVQMEISAACFSCCVLHVEELDGQQVQYLIKEKRGMSFKVQFSRIDASACCTCKHYHQRGLLCRHIFLVFKDENIRQIPDMYITSRWCKTRFIKPMYDVPDADFEALSAVEEKKIALNRLWSDLYYCVSAVEQKPDLLGGFSKIIRQQDILEAALRSGVVNTQNSIFECYYGVPAPANITVLPPQPVHNKGSGKRIKSAKELSIEQSKKNKRMCRKCQQLGYHDSRNCPKNISG
ncbi:unnamed protein product [Cuscuta campestris]|uniref:Protein FAR1-RELATED SEQUENCE n=1 Tax=Cuscuta campestris TaxID=132261 RepID=A0A484KAA9_9ASTE|nr:unnamed protein product [Cuscuta campestris]